MLVALTGTPGTGKSMVSKQLQNDGYRVLALNEIAVSQKLLLDYDTVRKTHEVDLKGMNNYLVEYLKKGTKSNLRESANTTMDTPLFLEGHISHLLAIVELVIILRCHPKVLRQRLSTKGWTEEKIRENLEAEAVDSITFECVDTFEDNKIFEIDTTNESPDEIAGIILKIINGDVTDHTPGNIDWSEEILKWF